MLSPRNCPFADSVAALLLVFVLAAGCSRVGTTVDDNGDTADTAEPECVEPVPIDVVQRAVNETCLQSWDCHDDNVGDRAVFISRCLRDNYAIARDCHRAADLIACGELTGRCAKFEAESCARAFQPCDG